MQTSHELRQAEQGAEVWQEINIILCVSAVCACVWTRCVECQAITLLLTDKSRCLSPMVYINCLLAESLSILVKKKKAKIKVALVLGNVNTLNFSLSVDILMESSTLSCQIKNSIGISKLSRSLKLPRLLQNRETARHRNLPKVIITIRFALLQIPSAFYTPNHTHSFLMQIHTTPTCPPPHCFPLASF